MKKEVAVPEGLTEFLLYRSPSGDMKVEVFIRNENVWLTQKKMGELFDVGIPAISKHLDNIYEEREVDRNVTISVLETVQKEGNREVKRKVEYYNLDAIISVGYRVNSAKATQFRIWATKILKEYIIKGFAMDDERLKNPQNMFGKDYFEEQLARIRDIRSSERRFYQKMTDIYAQCSADYDPHSKFTEDFFAMVQNKLHWAITRQTAAEIISTRVDSTKKNMGLTTWKNGPQGKIRKTDVVIAKNYLNREELDMLNRIVSMYLDYAELQAQSKKIMYMKDWIVKLDTFLQFNEKDILEGKGTISHEIANTLAVEEYEKFVQEQDRVFESDFDRVTKKFIDVKMRK